MMFLKKLAKNIQGATAIEYGLVVALVCLSSLVALQSMANENTRIWGHVKTQVNTATNKPN